MKISSPPDPKKAVGFLRSLTVYASFSWISPRDSKTSFSILRALERPELELVHDNGAGRYFRCGGMSSLSHV